MKTYKHKTNGSTMTYNDGCMRIDNLVIEGIPNLDYWEEVIEKDYEIIKQTVIPLPHHKFTNIESIKRLSDNVIFTVGDKVLCNEEYIEEIESITIFQENYLSFNFKNTANSFTTDSEWSRMQPCKPLLKTEDGVNIFEGDSYCFLNKKDFYLKVVDKAVKGLDEKQEYYLDFSTKELAEEYILMNKPILSLNDLLSVWSTDGLYDVYKESPMFQNFKNLAKTKL